MLIPAWYEQQIAPSNILDLFQNISLIHSYDTRSSSSGKFFKSNLKIKKKEILPAIWSEMVERDTYQPLRHFLKKKVFAVFLLEEIKIDEDFYDDFGTTIFCLKTIVFYNKCSLLYYVTFSFVLVIVFTKC